MCHQLDITWDNPPSWQSDAKEEPGRIYLKIPDNHHTKMSPSKAKIIDIVHTTALKRHLILGLIVKS